VARLDLSDLLESVAPTPRRALDIGHIERGAHRRRRRRRIGTTVVSVGVLGLFVGIAITLPDLRERRTVVAGPASARTIPVELRAGVATVGISLVDGTRLRVGLPAAAGGDLVGLTFADVDLHGSVYAGPAGRAWRVDIAIGSIENLVQGGEPIGAPTTSPASAATVDRNGHRLGLQFGPWALVASGDAFTDADIDALLTGVALALAAGTTLDRYRPPRVQSTSPRPSIALSRRTGARKRLVPLSARTRSAVAPVCGP